MEWSDPPQRTHLLSRIKLHHSLGDSQIRHFELNLGNSFIGRFPVKRQSQSPQLLRTVRLHLNWNPSVRDLSPGYFVANDRCLPLPLVVRHFPVLDRKTTAFANYDAFSNVPTRIIRYLRIIRNFEATISEVFDSARIG